MIKECIKQAVSDAIDIVLLLAMWVFILLPMLALSAVSKEKHR